MIVDPDQEYRIWYKKGLSCPSGSASGAILEWSGSEFYELSCWTLLVKSSGSNILHDNNVRIVPISHVSGKPF